MIDHLEILRKLQEREHYLMTDQEIVELGQAIAKEASLILIIEALQIAKEIAEETESQCEK